MEEEGKRLKDVFHIDIHSLKDHNYLKLDAFYHSLQKMMKIAYLDALKCNSWSGWLRQIQNLDEIGQLYRYQHFLTDLRHDGIYHQKLICDGRFLET